MAIKGVEVWLLYGDRANANICAVYGQHQPQYGLFINHDQLAARMTTLSAKRNHPLLQEEKERKGSTVGNVIDTLLVKLTIFILL
jgi:hypothetical protein